MTSNHLNPLDRLVGAQRLTRRRAIGYGGSSVAAAALASASFVQSTDAQDAEATPAAAGDAAISPERVAAAVTQLDAVIADALKRTGVPGVAVGIVFRDQIVHLAGYGVRKAGESAAVDVDTVFQLASVSKCLASTTVAAAVGDGAASWDSRLSDLTPEFQMSDSWITHEVTVRDLFCHRSGLAEHVGDDLEDLGFDRAEILRRLRYALPEGGFRDSYAYTNFGLTAAAVAVAAATGLAWEDLASKRLYEPLGMASTSSRFDDYIAAKNRAYPHVPVDGVYVAKYQRQPDAQSPAGGASSSVRDLVQWLRLLLGGGTIDGQELVDPTALGEAFRPHSVSNPAVDPAVDRTGFYGLGWNVGYDAHGRVKLNHSGAFYLGAATTVALLPVEQLGIVVLTNARPNGLAEAIAFSFMDLADTGAVANDYLTVLAPIIAASLAPKYGLAVDYAAPPANPGPPLALSSYTGDFTSDYYGTASVAIDGGALVLRLGPNQTAFPMRHYAHDVFLYQPVGENAVGESAVTFTIGAGGLASSVTIEILNINHQGTFDRPAPTA